MLNTSKSAKFYRLALFSSFFALLLVMLTAYTRVTELGIGCPDWPGCYGRLFAPITAKDIEEARRYQPSGADVDDKAWKDMTHRYLAGTLGLLMVRLSFLGWQLKKRKRNQQVIIPAAVMALVFTQAFVGAATTSIQFKPLVVMGHLIVGLTVLGLLWWVVLREQRLWKSVPSTPENRHLRPRALFALVLVATQVLLGGWTNANHAALACPDFPVCQGAWWPAMNWIDGFTLWRGLGLAYEGDALDLAGATAIHMAHRLGAVITLLYIGWLALHTIRVGFENNLCRYGLLVLVVLLAEVTLGVMNVVMHLPVAVAVAHSAGGALLLLALITLNHAVRSPAPR
ncbi:MAG TPA: COX15/CtaA family protein [Acidiferrobacterales bacterium]|jgi:cytochrome c oxidase assembly protein subunit 15